MNTVDTIEGKSILDSRGEWTIEVTVLLDGGAKGTVGVPQGKSAGSKEAVTISAPRAVETLATKIAPAFLHKTFSDQSALDTFLCEIDGTAQKEVLGGNVCLGVSLAYARAVSVARGIPLWRYVSECAEQQPSVPRLVANLINGGLHATTDTKIQEYLVIPKSHNPKTALGIIEEIYGALGMQIRERRDLVPEYGDEGGYAYSTNDPIEPLLLLMDAAKSCGRADDIEFGIDAAANGIAEKPAVLHGWYKEMIQMVPFLYLEDPYPEDDTTHFKKALKEWGKEQWIVGDDLTVTNPALIKHYAKEKAANAVIIKPNQIGTLSETIDAVKEARHAAWRVIVSHRSGTAYDTFEADLAYGLGADAMKCGAPEQPVRRKKYERLIEIAEDEAHAVKEE